MRYNRQTAAIHAATAQLTALTGQQPRVTAEPPTAPPAVRIEVDIPTDLLPRLWPRLLAVLDLGTTFGLRATPDGKTVWLRLELEETTRP